MNEDEDLNHSLFDNNKELNTFYTDDYEEKVELYTQKSIKEIRKIEPRWAYGENKDKLLDRSQHPECGNYKIFSVGVKDLLQNIESFGFNYEILFTGDLASDCKVASTLERWENNEYVDPPFLQISMYNSKKLSIEDGRHRTKLAYHMNQLEIPFAIYESLVNDVNNIIELKEI